MKQAMFAGTLAVFLFGFSPSPPNTAGFSPKSPMEGNWIGEFKDGATTLSFQVHFWTENGVLKGRIDIPKENIYAMPLDWIIVDASSVHFELVRECGTCVFDGELKNGRIVGDYLAGASKGAFYLISASVAMH
jgi:hypothetical protein